MASFKAIPLRHEVIPAIELRCFLPENLGRKQVATSADSTFAWWLGDVFSTTHASSLFVTRALTRYLSSSLREGIPIYARALRKKGLVALRKHKFQPLWGEKVALGQICKLSGDDEIYLSKHLRAANPRRGYAEKTWRAGLLLATAVDPQPA